MSSLVGGGTFHVEFNGVNKTGSITVPNTGDWQAWQTISTSVQLTAGLQVMRVVFDTSTDVGNLNWFNLYPTLPRTVEPSYFGLHVLGPVETNLGGGGVSTLWPSWSPTTVRLLNVWGYSTVQGKYSGLWWSGLNPAPGVYDWSLFDKVIAKLKAQGVTDVLYSFQGIPSWACGGCSGGDLPPTNDQDLTDFATAVARRAIADGLPIKFWEVWNEPNSGSGYWIGTTAQMVAMARTIYNAVKAVDPTNMVVTPPAQGNATAWMNGYLAAGGGAYADIMSFHGYTSSAPETIISLIDNYKGVFATYGQGGKPIWDTEAMDIGISNPIQEANFLAVYYLVHLAKGVERFYWYAYDGDQGQEWFYNTGINEIGIANIQLYNWMVGATLAPVKKWQCL